MNITKRLIVYRIEDEKRLSDFESAIADLDANFRMVIANNSMYFESDKNREELLGIFNFIPSDSEEFWLFTVTDSGVGRGLKDWDSLVR